MSQSSLSIANVSRSAFRAAVNAALQALGSLFSGSTAPSDPLAYQLWYDTGATPNVLKVRNPGNTDWVVWGRPADPALCPFYVNNAEVARFDGDGNLGVGTDSPAHKLDVDGDINVTGDFLVNGTPLTATPPDDSITFAKIQNFTANGVLCRASGTTGDPALVTLNASTVLGRGSTGNVAAITLGAGIAMTGTTLAVDHGTTANKIVRLDASARLPAVDGSLLTNVGGNALLGTFVADGTNPIDITGVFTSTYEVYELELVDIDISTNAFLTIRTSSDGGSSYDSGSGNYHFAYAYYEATSASVSVVNSTTLNYIRLNGAGGSPAERAASGRVIVYNPSETTARKKVTWDLCQISNAGAFSKSNGGGCRLSNSAVNAIRINSSAGVIESGKVHVYGRRA